MAHHLRGADVSFALEIVRSRPLAIRHFSCADFSLPWGPTLSGHSGRSKKPTFAEGGIAISREARRSIKPVISQFLEIIMRAISTAAIANALVRVFPASSWQASVLKQTALFCGAALLVWLLSMTYGLDLDAVLV